MLLIITFLPLSDDIVREVNDRLMLMERAFVDPRGLPLSSYYK